MRFAIILFGIFISMFMYIYFMSMLCESGCLFSQFIFDNDDLDCILRRVPSSMLWTGLGKNAILGRAN